MMVWMSLLFLTATLEDFSLASTPVACGTKNQLVSSGDSYVITSHDGYDGTSSLYSPGAKCPISFKRDPSCETMRFYCEAMDLEPRGQKNKCKDFLKISNGANLKEKFCGSDSIDLSSDEAKLSILFKAKSDLVVGKGFRCFVECDTDVPPPDPSSCVCGLSKPRPKIVGGEEAEAHEWPWQVGLLYPDGTLFCGGTVISERTILTAAHCMEQFTPPANSEYSVILAEHDQSVIQDNSILVETESFLIHPNYNEPVAINNDYALITLKEPIRWEDNEHIRPACLPSRVPVHNEEVVATGWGTLREGGRVPAVLHEVVLPVVGRDQCENYLRTTITEQMFCAGETGKDTCQGDSGGPVVLAEGGNYEVHGVTSWGFGCGNRRSPGVLATVFPVLDWIVANSDLTPGQDGCPRD